MKLLILIWAVVVNLAAFSQPHPGPVAIGRAGAGATLQGAWALQQNPAGIAEINASGIELGYVRHFMDRELSTQMALMVIPVNAHKLGISLQKYGLESYSDQIVGFTYARKLGRQLSLGMGFSYHTLHIQNYGASSILTAKAGFLFELTDRFTLGAYVFNPALSGFTGDMPIQIPAVMVFGFDYKLSDKIQCAADLKKTFYDPLDASIGLDYSPLSWFIVRGGLSAYPLIKYAGFGLKLPKATFNVAVSSHLDLGMTPQISLGYEF